MDAEDLRVVVVDDNLDFLEAIALLLQLDGYVVKTAANSVDALALIADFLPICVLTDINMEGVDGIELAAHLRAQYGQDITIIAVTGWRESDECVSKEFAKFDHFLRKPVEIDKLRQLLPPVTARRS